MRWQSGRRSTNVEDRRGRGSMPFSIGRRTSVGGGGILIIIVLLLLGVDPSELLQLFAGMPQSSVQSGRPVSSRAQDSTAADFVSAVLADTEDVWKKLFAAQGRAYNPPKLVLFSGSIASACGYGTAASGPFYCPGDQKAYLDLSFFEELKRLGGRGDFAAAYVIAHEIGHHVQNVLGTLEKTSEFKKHLGKAQANAVQVKVELQADCFAGVWAHHGHKERNILEEGDVEEGIQTASAIGDDRLQKMAGRGVQPESFTHGSAKQRSTWFLTGLRSGSLASCDTFS